VGVTATEFRLLVDEALALYPAPPEPPPADNGKADDGGGEGAAAAGPRPAPLLDETQRALREGRIQRMVPVCLGIVEHAIRFLCESGEDDGDELVGWSALPSAALLSLQPPLLDAARSAIEFLGDARTAANANARADHDASNAAAGSDAAAPSSRPPLRLFADHGRDGPMRSLVLACGRLLACWIAQDSEALRSELATAKVVPFLLQLSTYAQPRSPGTAASSSTAATSLPPPPSPAVAAAAPCLPECWAEGGDADSVDSDDEPSPAQPHTTQHAAATTPAGSSSSSSGSGSEKHASEAAAGFEDDDVLCLLLPALTALCDGSEDGPVELVESQVHTPVCAFVGAELERALAQEGAAAAALAPTNKTKLVPLVWAMGLLVNLLSDVAALAPAVAPDGDEGFAGGGGRIVDQACFAALQPCEKPT
jgi:hypothetical protein